MGITGGNDFKVFVIKKKLTKSMSYFGWLQSYYSLENMNTGLMIIENKCSKIIISIIPNKLKI
jgi:hypothetical protein